jgi:Xaa-Pro aminopeptidase
VHEGIIYIPGTHQLNLEDSDLFVPFRQGRYFYYLTGVDEPDCHVLYSIEDDLLTLFIPPIDPRQAVWFGRGSNRGEALEKYDVDKVWLTTDLIMAIGDALERTKGKLYILHPYHIPDGSNPDFDSISLQPAIERCRVIKDSHEIKLIRKANEISAKGHSVVLGCIRELQYEAQVEAIFKNVAISHGAKHQSYPVIAGSGTNASILHYTKNDEPLAGRQLLLLDAGTEYSCYASDVTRTMPLGETDRKKFGGWPSKEAADIYSLVLKMQTECIKRLKPGVMFRDLHVLAHAILIRKFLELGIFVGSEKDIIREGVSVAFFPHGLGHHMGLEVHDVRGIPIWSPLVPALVYLSPREASDSLFEEAGYPYLRDPSTTAVIANTSMTWTVDVDAPTEGLQEDMVITVEPGVYFNPYAIAVLLKSPAARYVNKELLRRYMPVGGVRIEDDILITRSGFENLTTAPKLPDPLAS